ncbi:MAG TPA: FlgO family outer membrane protein, partial [Spirochaetota bacterium]
MKKYIVLFFMIIAIPCLSQDSADDIAIDSVFKRMAIKFSGMDAKLKNHTVAVYGFEVNGRSGDSFASYSTEKLTHEIVETGKLKVVERSRIDRLLKEQQFVQTGLVDADSAAKIGRILSVDAVIIGTVRVTDSGIEFIARMIQSDTGIIIASSDERLKTVAASVSVKNTDTPEDETKISTDARSYITGAKITVTFSGMKGSKFDWITIVRSSESDSTYGEW